MANETKKENGYGYSKKKIWTVPPQCVLVCKNRWTGRVYTKGTKVHLGTKKHSKKALKINAPFTMAKLIDVTSRTDGLCDNDKVTSMCLDNFEVTVNPAITTRVVDAKKYEFSSKNPEIELIVKLQQVLRKVIVSNHYEDLLDYTIDLDNPNFSYFKNEFMDIENRCGLRLEKVYLQSVDPSQSMKDDLEKKAIQDRENARLISEAETKKKIAKLEAEAEKLKLSAIIDTTAKFAAKMKKDGIDISGEKIASYLRDCIISGGENTEKIMVVGSNDSKMAEAATTGVVMQKTHKA